MFSERRADEVVVYLLMEGRRQAFLFLQRECESAAFRAGPDQSQTARTLSPFSLSRLVSLQSGFCTEYIREREVRTRDCDKQQCIGWVLSDDGNDGCIACTCINACF